MPPPSASQETCSILEGDCIAGLNALPADSVHLAFADPPFNIGYEYDVYDDQVDHQQYVDWSSQWIQAVHRVLDPHGTFWLAIGDEYAAELKLLSQQIGFHCRSWVVWYYTFGVNCAKKFTRSHAHLFYFVKDPAHFTFRSDDLENRVPSARELVYNDKRANPRGRLPDDTWIIRPASVIGEMVGDDFANWCPTDLAPPSDCDQTFTLRPQDIENCFASTEDTWYFPRVAGTFKERAGFHGCQMPEQLLGRIIRTCSEPGQTVLDPFSGSATTLAVAKKLGRRWLGFELSEQYVAYGRERLDSIRVGDRLDGSPEPTKSAPRTGRQGAKPRSRSRRGTPPDPVQPTLWDQEDRFDEVQLELTLRGIVEAFRLTHGGFSADRLVVDPESSGAFHDACRRLGLVGDPRTWNTLLFRLRKAGQLSGIETATKTNLPWEATEDYIYASEIALQSLLNDGAAGSLDEILCDPDLAAQFDAYARQFAPGHDSLEYRWSALRLRKAAKQARSRGSVLVPPGKLDSLGAVDALTPRSVPETPGVYRLSDETAGPLYVGETTDLRRRIKRQFLGRQRRTWSRFGATGLYLEVLPRDLATAGRLAWQSCLIKRCHPRPKLNYQELAPQSSAT